MRGLIYKDTSIFFKSIDGKMLLIPAGAIALLMYNTGIYGGLLASVMLAMTVGMQNIISFACDEKVDWRKYQLAMPMSGFLVVASKYVSVICTLTVSLVGSILLNLVSSVLFGQIDVMVWGVSIGAAIILPLMWTAVCLPLTYWFGYHSAQTMGLIVVFPLFYLVKYFEDGPGIPSMGDSLYPYVFPVIIAVAAIFAVSLVVSIIGYGRCSS